MVGDHDRVGRDMIVVVEIIGGRLMREAFTRERSQTSRYVRNEQMPT